MREFIRDSALGFLSITALGVITFVMLFHFDIAGSVVMTDVDPKLLNIMEVAGVFLSSLLLFALYLSVAGAGLIRACIWEQKKWVEIRAEDRKQQALFVLKRLLFLIGLWVLIIHLIGKISGFW